MKQSDSFCSDIITDILWPSSEGLVEDGLEGFRAQAGDLGDGHRSDAEE